MTSIIRKVYIPLDGPERAALVKLAEREKRDPRQQAALLVRQALEALGLLEPVVIELNSAQQRCT